VRGLVTYYTLVVIELESRRVHLVGSTQHPDDAVVLQVARVLADADDGVLGGHQHGDLRPGYQMERGVPRTLADVGIRVVQTPFQAPNCNAHADDLSGRSRRNV
jgi:putative transposase